MRAPCLRLRVRVRACACVCVCGRRHTFDPDDVEDYLQRHPSLDMEQWLKNHSGG
jgi:hypothetical protein